MTSDVTDSRKLIRLILGLNLPSKARPAMKAATRSATRRRILRLGSAALALALCAPPGVAEPQQPTNVFRIVELNPISAPLETQRVFRQALRELGYVEGKTILFEYRFAEGKFDRLPDLAAELVRLNVDIIVVAGGRSTAAAKKATATIPIVVASAGDLLRAGLVASLAKPGGNITGSTVSSADVSGKRLELLRETIPQATRVAVL
jgi:putative tryptophan/tyrosine transport system substrate-binding protein